MRIICDVCESAPAVLFCAADEAALCRPCDDKMGKTKEGGFSAIWDTSDVMTFCDICIQEIGLGNRPTTHFNKEGWNNVVTKFKEQTGKNYDKLQMKNKWDHLKKDWKLWMELKRGYTGLGWNASRKTIDGSDKWWDERLQVVPAAKKFRYLGIAPELEEKLNMMFSSVVASGQQSRTASTRNQDRESIAERTLSESENDRPNAPRAPPIPETTGTSDASKKRKKGKKSAITLVLEDLADSSRAISERMPVPPSSPPHFTTSQALQKLHKYTEVVEDEKFFDFAVTFLMETKHRDTFMCLPEKADIKWLRNRYFDSA